MTNLELKLNFNGKKNPFLSSRNVKRSDLDPFTPPTWFEAEGTPQTDKKKERKKKKKQLPLGIHFIRCIFQMGFYKWGVRSDVGRLKHLWTTNDCIISHWVTYHDLHVRLPCQFSTWIHVMWHSVPHDTVIARNLIRRQGRKGCSFGDYE